MAGTEKGRPRDGRWPRDSALSLGEAGVFSPSSARSQNLSLCSAPYAVTRSHGHAVTRSRGLAASGGGRTSEWESTQNQTAGWTRKASGDVRPEVGSLCYCENVFGFHKERIGGSSVTESDSGKNLLSGSEGLTPGADLPPCSLFPGRT